MGARRIELDDINAAAEGGNLVGRGGGRLLSPADRQGGNKKDADNDAAPTHGAFEVSLAETALFSFQFPVSRLRCQATSHPLRRRFTMRTALAFALGFSLLAALPLAAQETPKHISGTVKDNQGVIPGATVKITNVETGVEQPVVTNNSGYFEAPLLRAGSL